MRAWAVIAVLCAIGACAAPAILTTDPAGGECHNGDLLATRCPNGACCPGSTVCREYPFARDGEKWQCEPEYNGPPPFKTLRDGGR